MDDVGECSDDTFRFGSLVVRHDERGVKFALRTLQSFIEFDGFDGCVYGGADESGMVERMTDGRFVFVWGDVRVYYHLDRVDGLTFGALHGVSKERALRVVHNAQWFLLSLSKQ
jgi:hypothetical protein